MIPTAKILREAVQQAKGRGPHDPEANRKADNGDEVNPRHGDPAAETIHAMKAWSDSILMTVARAMAVELQARGLIKNFNVA